MNKEIEEEVVGVLKNPNDVELENIQAEELSPLNQAVVEKEIPGVTAPISDSENKNWNVWKPDKTQNESINNTEEVSQNTYKEAAAFDKGPLDAPEQVIGEQRTQQATGDGTPKETYQLPTETAKQAADSILGMSNNVLRIGGGYFIKIKKHKEFYEFDEIVELIDAQNEKNIKRIALDKEDKALLKPILVTILKKKAKTLTPEQQLMGAVLSILMKKAQVVMEVRAENDLLVERILDIVREEKGYSDLDEDDDGPIQDVDKEVSKAYQDINGVAPSEDIENEQVQSEVSEAYDDEPEIIETIMEIAEEEDGNKKQEQNE